jgi:predicted alpha/beta superfamily hydrolase
MEIPGLCFRQHEHRFDGIEFAPGVVPEVDGHEARDIAPVAVDSVPAGAVLTLSVQADGTGPIEYQWLQDGEVIAGATAATYSVTQAGAVHAGEYHLLVHNLAGTSISSVTTVSVTAARRIEKHPAFPSRFVAPRQVDVWLPPGYEANSSERYPVVYMHDGQNLFDPRISYGGSAWEVDQALVRLIQQGPIRGAIVVGIWNTGSARASEYLPQKAVVARWIDAVPGIFTQPHLPIQSDAYLKFLVEVLKPWVDRNYRTKPDAPNTFIMGSSMGGLISVYALVEYPGVFGGAACVSTHWPAGNGAVIDYLAKHLPAPGAHKFYFDFGTETLDAGYEPYQRRMDAVMKSAGYAEGRDWVARKFPGAEHSEKYWRARVELPLEFLLSR